MVQDFFHQPYLLDFLVAVSHHGAGNVKQWNVPCWIFPSANSHFEGCPIHISCQVSAILDHGNGSKSKESEPSHGHVEARPSLTHANITSLVHAYVTCTCKSLEYVTCTCRHLLGGVGGVGGMITFLGLTHILECGWWVGRVGGWVGWVGCLRSLDLHT